MGICQESWDGQSDGKKECLSFRLKDNYEYVR